MSKTAAHGSYSALRMSGSFAFASGQVGIDPATGQAPAGVAAQTAQALANLLAVLQANGLEMDDVVKTTVFLKNIEDFEAMNEVYAQSFPEPRPARSTVAVADLPQLASIPLLVEIEAIASKTDIQHGR